MMCKGNHPGKSSVAFLPMIDMDSGDLTCIYSTLAFVAEQANRYNVTPIVTFDQPLWWKALTIVLNEPQESKLRIHHCEVRRSSHPNELPWLHWSSNGWVWS